jgi:hypothetical protein
LIEPEDKLQFVPQLLPFIISVVGLVLWAFNLIFRRGVKNKSGPSFWLNSVESVVSSLSILAPSFSLGLILCRFKPTRDSSFLLLRHLGILRKTFALSPQTKTSWVGDGDAKPSIDPGHVPLSVVLTPLDFTFCLALSGTEAIGCEGMNF